MLARRRLLLSWFDVRNTVAVAGGEVALGSSTRTTSAYGRGWIQGLTFGVTAPVDGAAVAFPFNASGTATNGATVTCYNDGTGVVLGTAVAAAGVWSMTINGST